MVFGNNMLLPDLDWPGTHYAVQGEFEFMILLPQYPHPIPHCWDHRHVPPCPAVHSPSVPIQPTVNYRLHCILLQSWSQSQHKGSVKQVFPGLMGPLKYTSLCQQYNKNGKKKKKCSALCWKIEVWLCMNLHSPHKKVGNPQRGDSIKPANCPPPQEGKISTVPLCVHL